MPGIDVHLVETSDGKGNVFFSVGDSFYKFRRVLIEEWLTQKLLPAYPPEQVDEIRGTKARGSLARPGENQEYELYRLTDRLLRRLLAIYLKIGGGCLA